MKLLSLRYFLCLMLVLTSFVSNVAEAKCKIPKKCRCCPCPPGPPGPPGSAIGFASFFTQGNSVQKSLEFNEGFSVPILSTKLNSGIVTLGVSGSLPTQDITFTANQTGVYEITTGISLKGAGGILGIVVNQSPPITVPGDAEPDSIISSTSNDQMSTSSILVFLVEGDVVRWVLLGAPGDKAELNAGISAPVTNSDPTTAFIEFLFLGSSV